MNGECPIVPSGLIKLTYGDEKDDYLLISASHDSVQMFSDETYNHLRYYDGSTGELKAIWLGGAALTGLIQSGIPITIRESITEGEYECYQTYLSRVSMACVEIEEVQLSDAEIDFYLGEWEA